MRIPQRLMVLDLMVRSGTPVVSFLLHNLTIFLTASVEIDRYYDKHSVQQLENREIFDFIVVGSGSSGSILASHLSENFRVLLLEAGGTPSPILSVPIWSYMLSNQPAVDWGYRTEKQKHAAFALNDNVSFWGSGKGLGGSSLINGLIFIRGNTQGFDLVAKKTNDTRWSLKNILERYKQMEDYHGLFDDGKSHGKDGEVCVENSYLVPFINNLMRAGEELGYKIRDPNSNGPLTEGFAPMDYYLKGGRRHDAYTGSLLPILSRENLVIRKFSFVTKILFKGKSAYGVLYERHGQTLEAWAEKEVILSAGSIRSAQLLMLSGIGPKEHLEELKIPLLANLPVGKRLEDKYGALVGPFTVDKGTSFKVERDITYGTIYRWLMKGVGMISAGRSEATQHILTNYARDEGRNEVPDIHTYTIAISPTPATNIIFQGALNFNQRTISHMNSVDGQDSFFQFVTLSRPFGSGSLRLNNTDPHNPPLVDPKYLEDPRDVKTLVQGIKFSVSLVENTLAFKEINGKLLGNPLPGCTIHEFKSDTYFECVARHATLTAYKYSGTAPMGRDTSDTEAVVDSQLRVFGVKGLRVVDGSVLQVSVVSVNDVTCRMLGHLVAEMIKDTWDTNNLV